MPHGLDTILPVVRDMSKSEGNVNISDVNNCYKVQYEFTTFLHFITLFTLDAIQTNFLFISFVKLPLLYMLRVQVLVCQIVLFKMVLIPI